MCVMSCTHLNGPILHTGSDFIRNLSVDFGTMLDCRHHSFVSRLGHISSHFLSVKYVLTEIRRCWPLLNEKALTTMSGSFVQSSLSECSHKINDLIKF